MTASTAKTKPASQSVMKTITSELNSALSTIAKKHGVILKAAGTHLSKRGIINIGIKGKTDGTEVQGPPKVPRPRANETLPEMRMRLHAKAAGVSPNIIHKMYKQGSSKFEVLGMKGKANKILLRNQHTNEVVQVLPDDFKEKFKKA